MEATRFDEVTGYPAPWLDPYADEYIKKLIEIRNPDPPLIAPVFSALLISGGLAYYGGMHWLVAVLIVLCTVVFALWRSYLAFESLADIYREGIVFRHADSPFAKTRTWVMYPWQYVIDIDFRNREFAFHYKDLPETGSGRRSMKLTAPKAAKQIAEQFEALQVRGDIPRNIKVWSK